MAAPLSAQNAESGVVVEFLPSVTQPIIPNDVRTVGLIGKGKTTKTILNQTLTRGVAPDTADTLLPAAASLPSTIIDQNLNSYSLDVDYQLTSGNVDWSLNGPANFTSIIDASAGLNVNGLTFVAYINGGVAQSVTLSGTNPISQSNIIAQLSPGLTLTLNINGDGAQTITLGANASGAAVAADIQAKVRALTAFTPSNQLAYDDFTAVYSTVYTLTSGLDGTGSSVVVSGGTAAVSLKLGTGNGGTELSGTLGTSVSDTTPATSTTSGDTLTLNINGDGAQTIILATSGTGADVAADIEAKVRALTAFTPSNQPAYNNFTAVYTTVYTLTSGAGAHPSSVVVSGGTAAAALKLGIANGGTEAIGTYGTSASNTSPAITTPTGISGVAVTAVGNFIKIATIAVNNATLLIGAGTANTALGFTGGLLAVGPKEPTAGVTYSFDYETAKLSADYVPTFFTNLDDIVTAYGDINTTNTLSLGAQIVFTNSAGTGGIWAIQLNPADTPDLTGFRNALNKLAIVERVNIIVPLTGDPNLYQDVKQHVVNSSAPLEKKERTSILGMQGNPTFAQAQSYAAGLAAGGNGRRLLLLYPPSAVATVAGSDVTLDGSFLAAAVAGVRINSNFDVAEPLLRKALLGFNEIQSNLTRTNKLILRNSGVTVIEMVDGVVRITEDTTVDRTSADNQEYTVTEIVDFTASTTRRLIDAIFIGIKLLPDTPNLVAATLNVILSTLVDLRIINSFQNIKAGVNSVDPRQIDISFSIQPTRTLRFIKITFSI